MATVVVRERAEVAAVPDRLFEVIADDLVELNEVRAPLLEPRSEALVQFGAGRLRQRLVGGVANQQVAEAVAVVTG